MRVTIVVTNDEGQTFEGDVDLAPAETRRGGARRARRPPALAPAAVADAKVVDLKLPLRAFLKKHVTGGGPQKFAVLLAPMTGGKTGVGVTGGAPQAALATDKGVPRGG